MNEKTNTKEGLKDSQNGDWVQLQFMGTNLLQSGTWLCGIQCETI